MATQENQGKALPSNIGQALEERSFDGIEKQVRREMQGNPATEQVDKEISYRQAAEKQAIKALSVGEQTICWKLRLSGADYVRGKK